MSDISDILASVPIASLAKQFGATQAQTKSAATTAITGLLGGLTQNASSTSGAEALMSALGQHAGTGSLLSAGTQLAANAIDTTDGAKIVQHALGADVSTVATALSSKTGADKSLLSQLLPYLAPVVMAYLANKAFGKGGTSSTSAGAIGGILGAILVGSGSSSSNGLGDLLGGILGGSTSSKKSTSSNGLGDLFGTLFGTEAPATPKTTKKTTSTTSKKTTNTTKKSTTTASSKSSGGLLDTIIDALT
ncbi:MAG: DUF937 domain-containing protein [Propionibacteriaceae bacterium]|jgi:hypothetical protein|nr:DUF937 domain-containing protein [Propionibacteriaceae bacterium]